MAQEIPRFCPRCGSDKVTDQHFCARCGLNLAVPQNVSGHDVTPPSMPDLPTTPQPAQPSQISGHGLPPSAMPKLPSTPEPSQFIQPSHVSGHGLSPSTMPERPSTPRPVQFAKPSQISGHGSPPELPDLPTTPQPAQMPQASPSGHPAKMAGQRASSIPAGYGPSAPPLRATRKRSGGRLVLALMLVVLLAVLGIAGYVGATQFGLLHAGPLAQPPVTTTPLNAAVTYAGAEVSVVKVEQAQSFIDDPDTSTAGMVRVYLQGQNKATVPVDLSYTTITHLMTPGGKTVGPTYVKSNANLAPGATQTSMVDFAVPMETKIDQLTLRLGAANEAQMDIPLKTGIDLSRYAPRTTQIGGKLQYLGLDWTVVSATTQLSIDGQQASKGMHYVTVSLKVDSTLVQTAIPGSPYDYMRLKAGATAAVPSNTTLPVSFEAGVKGKTGTVTFLIPQNATAVTFIMVPQNQGGFKEVALDFHL